MFIKINTGHTARQQDDPINLLSECHRRIEYFLNLIITVKRRRQGQSLQAEEREALERAQKYFREAAPKHTADEEASLFPQLKVAASSNPTVFNALTELEAEHLTADANHQELESLIELWLREDHLSPADTGRLSELLSQLSRLYHRHIHIEEQDIFPFARKVLKEDQIRNLQQEMARRRGLAPADDRSPSHSETR